MSGRVERSAVFRGIVGRQRARHASWCNKQDMGGNMSDWVSELVVAERVGMSRPMLRGRRREMLEEGVDWKRERGSVVYAESGVVKLLGALGGELPLVETVEVVSQPVPVPVVRMVRVMRIWLNKRRHLAGEIDGERVMVRVRNSGKFRVGQELPCELRGAVWWYVGRGARKHTGRKG